MTVRLNDVSGPFADVTEVEFETDGAAAVAPRTAEERAMAAQLRAAIRGWTTDPEDQSADGADIKEVADLLLDLGREAASRDVQSR